MLPVKCVVSILSYRRVYRDDVVMSLIICLLSASLWPHSEAGVQCTVGPKWDQADIPVRGLNKQTLSLHIQVEKYLDVFNNNYLNL